ncbi:hypothetical protein ACFX1W_036194 [Malus domestica]
MLRFLVGFFLLSSQPRRSICSWRRISRCRHVSVRLVLQRPCLPQVVVEGGQDYVSGPRQCQQDDPPPYADGRGLTLLLSLLESNSSRKS